ncbi:Rho-type gtpase-activating protein [Hypoxylon texense]
MLEKTAASLEPCGFQRVVPGATQSFRTTRQLRTAFWQHGAADLELTTAWQTLMHGTSDLITNPPPEDNNDSALGASTFLLDFLYPSGAATLMRRLTPITTTHGRSNSFPYGQRFVKLTPRPYTSSLPRRQDHRPSTGSVTGEETRDSDADTLGNETDGTSIEQHEVGGTARTSVQHGDTDQGADPKSHAALTQSDSAVNDRGNTSTNDNHAERLKRLLDTDDPKDADPIWYHYKALDESSQLAYMRQVLLFLSKSGRLSDSWKISELFHKVPLSLWTNGIFVAGVTAETNLQNAEEALEIFVKGLGRQDLDNTSLVDALDLLLSSALRSPTSQALIDVWKHYPDMKARWDFDGVTSQLKHVASVPDLAGKALEFQSNGRYKLLDFENTGLSQEALDVLQRILIRRALVSCAKAQVIPLLKVTKDHLAFEEFLHRVTSSGKEELGFEVYQIYRDLPGSMPSHSVLHEMFRLFRRFDLPMSTKYAGFELLWGDWHKFHTTPSRRAFQRYMAFYASQGETQRVYDLWTKYVELYRDDPDHNILQGNDTFTHLLQVHAVRGEAEEVQRIFNAISEKFNIEPNAYHWNILLNAYAKAGDYDGAIATFEETATVGKADNYSYGTMMQMAGERGDLGFTIDLYRRAVGSGVRVNEAILNSLVDAYCQNDYLQAAEDVCVRAVSKGIVATQMWNKLIHHYALRRDLAAMNRILESMVEHNIPYNKFTYQKLLMGLSLCRQSQHALSLLTSALKDNIFQVTADHFHIVMGALLRTGEPAVVQRLHKLMQDYGFSSTSESMFRLTQTLAQWNNLPPAQRARFTSAEWLSEALHSFGEIYGLNDTNKLKTLPSSRVKGSRPGRLLAKRVEKIHFSAMVFMFTQMKDFFGAQQLIDLYRHVFQGQQDSDATLPIAMLNSIMLMDFQEGHYDRVRATWSSLLEAVKKEARSPDEELHTSKISPRYRYILSGGLEVMQRMLFTLEDAAGMQQLVREVRFKGFEIDSKNWNYYVQSLAQLKEYKAAFQACEKVLMPNWTGWSVMRSRENVRRNIDLDRRRKGRSRRHLRPVATTLYYLAQSYIELGQLSLWSSEAARTAREIEVECTQVVRAIKSMRRVYSKLEYEIFDKEDHIDFDSVDVGHANQGRQTRLGEEGVMS